MFWKKNSKEKEMELAELIFDDEELDDDEFFLAEEIDGYSCCEGLNAQKCSSDCFRAVMMPTVTIMS